MALISSAATSNVNFAPPNMGHLSSQIVPVLKSHELIGFVDGSEPCPSKFIDDNPEDSSHSLNPDYILWNKKDQCVLSWINATLSDKVLASVYDITSARECMDNVF
ncbi:hypothetical protein Peur_034978 [Populus x canadensis]